MRFIQLIVGMVLTIVAYSMWMGPMVLSYPASGWPLAVALGGIILIFPASYFLYEGWLK